tara:strand:+ start:3310 stop:3822 length:513 start_codon:yes stop_codon:yes gene_type:complete
MPIYINNKEVILGKVMFARLFILFTAVSLLEIFVLVKVGGFLGAIPTVALVVVTALVGSALVRSQGLQVIQQYQQRVAKGEMPGQQLVEGLMLIITGVLLVTPGFVTDFCGLLLLQPTIRATIAKTLLANIKFSPASMTGNFSQPRSDFSSNLRDEDVIEGEFEHKKDDK